MIALKTYQEKAVDGLLTDTYSLLNHPNARQRMVFKAPTGAGKTVTMAAYLNRLCEELPDKPEFQNRQVAFIWLAPNQLHLQSFQALKHYFSELRSIKPIQFGDVTEGRLLPNQVLFLNWQSVNKENNLYIKENEADKTLIKYINQARLHDTEIILILDEAHLFASKGKAAQELLHKIYAKIEIDVSATPLFKSDYGYTIKRPDVINAEMIKKNVILNPKLDAHEQHGYSVRQVLLKLALKKREELKAAYELLGIPINPLLLIQLPNDSKNENADDIKAKEEVMAYLQTKDITTQNHKLAVWLSNTKTNLEGIEAPDSMVDVLLFKQAIALGWDCPRAAVLLIFREIQQEAFTIQTVGRILRMPQQKHYPDALLNYGYVYTDVSRDIIQIVKDDMDYIVQNKAIRKAEYASIGLTSYFINTRLTRNRLSSKFRRCLFEAAEEYFNVSLDVEKTNGQSLFHYNADRLRSRFIELDVNAIEIPIPRDVQIAAEIGVTEVRDVERFAKTTFELTRLFRIFCQNHVGSYAKTDSWPVLELALLLFLEEYIGMSETSAIKVVLYEQNKARFIEVIDRALEKHEKLLEEKAAAASKRVDSSTWEVPSERIYNEHYEEKPAPAHALEPYYEMLRASRPEQSFASFLEQHHAHLNWWYKNGDKNKEDFAVTYTDRHGVLRGFYVDFVIQLKNGTIALFDTKTLDSDTEFVSKHNALHAYIQEQNAAGKDMIGGIIVPKGEGVWKYCDNLISSSKDTTGWISFDPALVNQIS
jgi:type III restriction enzyme